MTANSKPAQGQGLLWTGRIPTTLGALFLFFDAVAKLLRLAPVVEGTTQLGYSASVILPLGIVLLLSTVLYVLPRTANLGAILLTGYLGGAVATHVRAGNPLATHVLFPVYLGVLLWGGLYLRNARLRAQIPLRSPVEGPLPTKGVLWTGRILAALPALLLLMSGSMKLMKTAEVVEGFTHLGYAQGVIVGLGIVELACLAIYLLPRTSVLGAILLTGYLGGATATHLRIGEPFIAPVIVGVALWGALYCRDARLRSLLPIEKA